MSSFLSPANTLGLRVQDVACRRRFGCILVLFLHCKAYGPRGSQDISGGPNCHFSPEASGRSLPRCSAVVVRELPRVQSSDKEQAHEETPEKRNGIDEGEFEYERCHSHTGDNRQIEHTEGYRVTLRNSKEFSGFFRNHSCAPNLPTIHSQSPPKTCGPE